MSIDKPSFSKAATRHYKGIVWALAVGAVFLGAVTQRALFAGVFTAGGTSGQLAKLLFRLPETFHPTSVTWSPDGRYIATASTLARSIHIWDMGQRKIVKELPIPYPAAYFHELSFSPDGRYLAACDGTGVLRIYRTRSWTMAHIFSELHGHGGCDHPVFSSDSQQIAAVATRFLEIFSVPDWRTIKSLRLDSSWGRGDLFNTIAYVPNSHTVLVGGGQYLTITVSGKRQASWEGRVWFFAPSDRVPSRSMRVYGPAGDRGGGGDADSLTTSPDGRYVVTGAKTGAGDPSSGLVNQSTHILNRSTGALMAAPLDGLQPVKFPGGIADAYTHDGRYIIVPHEGRDGWIHVLDGRTFKVIDLMRSDAFNYDVAVAQVNDDFAVGTNEQVIIWSLPD